MFYLNGMDILTLGIDWKAVIQTLEETVKTLDDGDYAQPLKPYLRYKNMHNRIIAMPAYVGGNVNTAGIKWISSFPGNVEKGLPRAHSVVILNDADTGKPAAIINTPLISIIRTAAVSGLMVKYFLLAHPQLESMNVGIIGWGPVGRHHFQMLTQLYGERINHIYLYDLRGIDPQSIDSTLRSKVTVADSWEQVYRNADVFITCTVSDHRYIDTPPRPGSLLLHVSLRDYRQQALNQVRAIVVDDWEEVCRENTDIELLHKVNRLSREDTISINDVVCRKGLERFGRDEPVLFSPMGMAVFDISTAVYYWRFAVERGIGLELAE